MQIDVTSFFQANVIDTCAIWHVLSSRKMTRAARTARCSFAATDFVYYEALYKPRSNMTSVDIELMERLRTERATGMFGASKLHIDDLQDVDVLNARMKLGKGELSSLVFAKKSGLAFMTDDQRARRVGEQILMPTRVQTTPHLFGWLFFTGALDPCEREDLICEHELLGGKLRPHLQASYDEAMRCLLMTRAAPS